MAIGIMEAKLDINGHSMAASDEPPRSVTWLGEMSAILLPRREGCFMCIASRE